MVLRALLLAALVTSPVLAQETFTVTTTADNGAGSLRRAIEDANRTRNAAGGPDRIEFAIPGTGPFTISPTVVLPTISEAVVIDGLSQPGADCSTWPATLLIELDGQRTGSLADGLTLESSSGSTVRGLVVNRFDGDGVDVKGSGGNTFECNYIGTDVTGTLARPNADDGIDVESPDNVIGGSTPSARNLLSGNGNDGIDIDGFGVNGSGNVIQGNYIGVAVDGTSPLGNSDEGIELQFGASSTLVGGTESGEGNVIAHNDGNGIKVEESSSIRNSILRNAIFGNGARGIELEETSSGEQTGNDSRDRDSGPNGLQNYPVLTAARTAENTGATTIEGTLNSTPNTTFRVELFANDALDPDGFGPGAVFVAAVEVTTDAGGDGAFVVELEETLEAGVFVTSTATDDDGNTSEFGRGVEVDALMNTSADETPDAMTVTVSPNPASDVVFVSLAGSSEAEVVVYDMQGRAVFAELLNQPAEVSVPLTNLAPGVYMIRVTTARSTQTAQITVAR